MSSTAWFVRWGTLGFVLGVLACSSEGSAPTPQQAASTAMISNDVDVRVEALRSRFAGAVGATTPVTFERMERDAVRAVLPPTAKNGVTRPARVELPTRAKGFARVEDDATHMGVSFALRGAKDVEIAIGSRGIAVYRGALDGADVLHRVHAEGTEDFIVFETAPALQSVEYDVDVSEFAGLRLIERTLELLDETGTPRLRIAPPYLLDANAVRREATLAVDGCAYDTSPSAPWNRAVTKPGSARCIVTVSWKGPLKYPALLDPSWVSTGSMASTRSHHTATVLASGKVLVAGGSGAGLSTELYDPASGTFGATGSLAEGREEHTASLLGSGKVLIAGGKAFNVPTETAEVYDPAAGTFSSTGAMPGKRSDHTATVLPSGKVLVAGGCYEFNNCSNALQTALLYDPVTGAFTATGSMSPSSQSRKDHTATLLTTGKVLVAGGDSGQLSGKTNAMLYDPALGTFAATGSLNAARYDHTATALVSGKILIAGGATSAGGQTAELYDPAAGTFTPTGSPTVGHSRHTSTRLASGKVLVIGGFDPSGDLYDPIAGTFSATASLPGTRYDGTASLLGSGKVLFAGGSNQSAAYLYDLHPPGGTCAGPNDCVSGVCNDGVCCSGACAGTCKTCSPGTGACVNVSGADDPDTCTGVNTCDTAGNGTCKPQNGQSCTSGSACASGFCADGVCCNTACGSSCDVCNLSGSVGTCGNAAPGSSGSPACGAYLCNGSSASCPSTCASDSNCSSAYYCASDSTCKPRKSLAAACNDSAGQDCKVAGCRVCTGAGDGNCIDGFCCNTACGAACDVCSIAAGATTNGTCATAPLGTQTAQCSGGQACNGASTNCASVCASDSDCVITHYCSAGGTCLSRKNQANACNSAAGADCKVAGCRVCTTNNCVDGYCCNDDCGPCGSCSVPQAGTCTPKPAQQPPSVSCGLYLCDGGTASCPTSCSVNGDCIAGNYCVNGSCVSKLPIGASCANDGQCQSTHCADGVCCDTSCSGTCMACAAANKQSGAGNGVCGVAKLGTNPGGQCAIDTTNPCGTISACQGTTAACALVPFGTSCGPTTCSSASTVSGQVCNGAGTCITQNNAQCAPFLCKSGACSSPCAFESDCVAGNYCQNGACVPKIPPAGACDAANKCLSGFCVDGVCCDAPCNGQCEACDVSGSLGQCKTVSGAPHGSRPPCDGTGLCQGTCNGTDPTVCSFPASATACAPAASCVSGDVAQPAGSCDGTGDCSVPGTKNCLPYACDTTTGACNTGCTSNVDCAQGAECDTVTGKCAITGASCKDPYTVKLPNGVEQSCKPYLCVGGACLDACATASDCAPGYACDAPTCVVTDAGTGGSGGGSGSGGSGTGGGSGGLDGGAGAPTKPASEDDGGCGCRVAPERNGTGALVGLLLGLVAFARGRRRRG